MSIRYPHDRGRDRQVAGEQLFKDAREALNQQEANLQAEAEGYGEEHSSDAGDGTEDKARQEEEAAKRLAEVGDEVNEERDRDK